MSPVFNIKVHIQLCPECAMLHWFWTPAFDLHVSGTWRPRAIQNHQGERFQQKHIFCDILLSASIALLCVDCPCFSIKLIQKQLSCWPPMIFCISPKQSLYTQSGTSFLRTNQPFVVPVVTKFIVPGADGQCWSSSERTRTCLDCLLVTWRAVSTCEGAA